MNIFFIIVSPMVYSRLSFALMISFLQVQVGVKELETGKIPSGLARPLPILLPYLLPCPTGSAPSPGRPAGSLPGNYCPPPHEDWLRGATPGMPPGSRKQRWAFFRGGWQLWLCGGQRGPRACAAGSAADRHRRKSPGGTVSRG